MSIRKLMILIALALAITALIPASALAEKNGAHLPSKGTISGTVTLTFTSATTAVFVSDCSGIGIHIGKFTCHFVGEGHLTALGTLEGESESVVTVANGDKLYETGVITTTALLPTGHTSTSVDTIVGGTGRFEGATGEGVTVLQVTPLEEPIPGVQFVNTYEGTYTGYVNH